MKVCVGRLVVAVAGLIALPAQASVVLFDGNQGTLPSEQGWIYLTRPLVGSSATQTIQGNTTLLDTSVHADDQAGYFRFPGTLDRMAGFDLTMDLQVLSEAHDSVHRAGFSIITLTDDRRGLELAFWSNEIWAQNDSPLFTHGEGAAFETTAGIIHYDLAFQGNSYTLFAAGTPILSGALRDYSSFGPPYNVNNLLFMGDDTSSASGRFLLARVTLETAAVPEVSAGVFVLFAGAAFGLARWTRSRRP